MFAQVVRAIEALGAAAATEKIEAALESGEPLLLALRPSTSNPVLTTEAIPTSVPDIAGRGRTSRGLRRAPGRCGMSRDVVAAELIKLTRGV